MLSKGKTKLLSEAVEIEAQEAQDAGAVGYMARMLVQATMPHSDPGDVTAWGRRAGSYSLIMQPGVRLDDHGQAQIIGLPYGTLPRLLLSWLSTEAVRTRNPVIVLGGISQFLQKLDLIPNGGPRGTITRVRNQMIRLFSAHISCKLDIKGHWATSNIQIAEGASLWWHHSQLDQGALWESTVTLGHSFFCELVNNAVPVDMRALKALRRSSLALDIYCWLTYRMSYLHRDIVIPWPALAAQFGADFGRLDNFKAAFLGALRKVLVIYPSARAIPTLSGLLLKPSKTHISCG